MRHASLRERVSNSLGVSVTIGVPYITVLSHSFCAIGPTNRATALVYAIRTLRTVRDGVLGALRTPVSPLFFLLWENLFLSGLMIS